MSRIATNGSKNVCAQPEAFDLRRDPLPLLGLDDEVVDVFVLDHSVDRDVQGDLLRLGEVVVRLDFLDFGQRAHAEE